MPHRFYLIFYSYDDCRFKENCEFINQINNQIFGSFHRLKFIIIKVNWLRITEIGIDDSQTGYYWLQIYVKNQRDAFSLKKQILQDQEIRERLHAEIKQSQTTVNNSSIELEIILHNMIIKKLQSILEYEK